jgi:hypothetical protein
MKDKQTTKQCPAARGQSNLGWGIIIRGNDPRDVAGVKPAAPSAVAFRKMVLIGLQVIGSARVHHWTPHKPTEPHAIFLKVQNLRKINFWAEASAAKEHGRGDVKGPEFPMLPFRQRSP